MEENKHKEEARPFFSIVIPIYNAAKYLRDCLLSIEAQDFDNWEAILVDDGSSDDSLEIAKGFSITDNRIKVYASDKNSGGAYSPRLNAASLAHGDYIVTVDADDVVDSKLLKEHYDRIMKYDSDLVIPEMWRFDDNSRYKILPNDKIDVSELWNGKDLVAHTICEWDIPMCGFAIRREIYLNADSHISEEDKKSIFADELLSRWLLFMSEKVSLTSTGYFYRLNDESVTSINVKRYIDSRFLTCDGLIAMATEAFGEGSTEQSLATKNKFNCAIGALRMINSSDLSGREKKILDKRVAAALQTLDLSALKGMSSPRYLALMSLPTRIARLALRLIDPLLRLRNGL